VLKIRNILFFNNFTLSLFNHLYADFPLSCDIDITEFALDLLPDDLDVKDGIDKLEVARASLSFLRQEGFIVISEVHNDKVYKGVRLTMKGLASLGYVPNSLEPDESIISKINDIAKDGFKEAGVDVTKNIVQQLFSVALASSKLIIS